MTTTTTTTTIGFGTVRQFWLLLLVLLIVVDRASADESTRFMTRLGGNNNEKEEVREPMQRERVGGWAPVEDVAKSTNAEDGLISASLFCLHELQSPTEASTELPSDTFSSDFLSRLQDSPAGDLSPLIVAARKQVVAGMNYKMTIVVVPSETQDVSTDTCLGAFEATVYDAFGTLSVTRWGKEYSLDEAKALLVDYLASKEAKAANGDKN